jgi:ribosome biogenesis protein Tsr3
MHMKLTIEQAIERARKKQSLEGVVIEDLKETQVRAVDALILAEYGIVIIVEC